MIVNSKQQYTLRQKRIGMLQTHPQKINPYSKEHDQLKRDQVNLPFENEFTTSLLTEFRHKLEEHNKWLDEVVRKLYFTQSQDKHDTSSND